MDKYLKLLVFFRHYYYVLAFFVGAAFMVAAYLIYKDKPLGSTVEILYPSPSASLDSSLVVEVAGFVEAPGVYRLESGARIEELLIAAGGLSADADREWVGKNINRAQRLLDGQKLYIPSQAEDKQLVVQSANNFDGGYGDVLGENSGGFEMININTASLKQLEQLDGIGPVLAQKIAEYRPYSNVEELIKRKVISQSVYEKNKNRISI